MSLYPEDLDAAELRERFRNATGELAEWRDEKIAKLQAKADAKRAKANGSRTRGRKPKPESERRTNRFQLCFNAAEYDRVRAYVGDRETGEVLRELILSALPPENAD